jgi:GntR family transcriptional regulator/MocR family aminotransferase
MLVPPRLVEAIALTKEHLDRGSPSLEQLAFADFLERGEFDLHLRRMRPIYRRRRDVLLRALREHLPEVRPVGASAGLHVLAWLPDGADEAAILRLAREAGVGLFGLASHGWTQTDGPGALDFGYGSVTESEIVEGVRIVADALRRSGRAPAREETAS